MLCDVYKSPRRQEMYLYVARDRGLECVPEVLLQQFGEPQPVMQLLLKAERKLARVAVEDVMASLREQGYFLQMPPTPAELRQRERADD